MRSEGGTKEGHAALLKLHSGAHLTRSSQNASRTKIAHAHRGNLCRRRPSRTNIDVPTPILQEADLVARPPASEKARGSVELTKNVTVHENRKRVFGYGYARDSQKSLLSTDSDLECPETGSK